MKFVTVVLINFLIGFIMCSAQVADSLHTRELKEVVVSAYKVKPKKYSSFIVEPLHVDSLSLYGSYNLCDILARIPGISMLSTGPGIAKPVIRGLYGNRILVLLNSLKFDNQQWQEEHGLGLSSIGLSRVELIKGPLGILYGTEAIGGIINLIEEEKPEINSSQSDLGISFNSNTLGGLMQAGFKERKTRSWWRIRLGIENNADYSDGNNHRVLNSRSDGYYIKASLGFEKKHWSSVNNYSASFNRFGFIFNDVYNFILPDDRWSRKLNENPAHLVLLNILSSENIIQTGTRSNLKINFGVQSNKRMENEGGGAISLNMHLLTIQNMLKYEFSINGKNKIIVSNLLSYEDNTNLGARKIIPDARMQEANLSIYLESYLGPHLIFENGIGAGEKFIHAFFTASVNGPDKELKPFQKNSPYYNVYSGITYFPTKHFNLKANLASGVRVANLAELSSDGLHEGVFNYEIGNPDLKNEQILSANLYLNFTGNYVELSISPFYNYFENYIYLSPTSEEWFGFPVFRFVQQNAKQYGLELNTTLNLFHSTQIKCSYSGMTSETEDKNYTPYIPPSKICPGLLHTFDINKLSPLKLYIEMDWNFAQNNVAINEPPSPQYNLWNASISTEFKIHQRVCKMALSIDNIFNKAYRDHLSRFKYFGLLDMGRNISLNFNIIL